MKLLCKKLSQPINMTFSVTVGNTPNYDEHLHYHPECELTWVRKGSGTKLVGDSMYAFEDGDLTFLGPDVPHLWQNEEAGADAAVDVVTIHFHEEFLGKDFFQKQEMAHIRQFFVRSKSGFTVKGNTRALVVERVERLITAQGFERVLLLLDILNLLAASDDLDELSSQGYSHNFTHTDAIRMNNIYNYLLGHFKDDVTLEEIASVACLSPSAFCKYFKKHTGKTFSEFLNELKIGHACKMLIEADYSIAEVCYESGFQSLTNFNRQFKNYTSVAPYEYRRQFQTRSFPSAKRVMALAC